MGNGRYTREGKEKAERIEAILRASEYGLTQGQLAVELGMKERARLDSQLASLDKHGVMVSEDERGRIYIFDEWGIIQGG